MIQLSYANRLPDWILDILWSREVYRSSYSVSLTVDTESLSESISLLHQTLPVYSICSDPAAGLTLVLLLWLRNRTKMTAY